MHNNKVQGSKYDFYDAIRQNSRIIEVIISRNLNTAWNTKCQYEINKLYAVTFVYAQLRWYPVD